jgi:hypothetical protein
MDSDHHAYRLSSERDTLTTVPFIQEYAWIVVHPSKTISRRIEIRRHFGIMVTAILGVIR